MSGSIFGNGDDLYELQKNFPVTERDSSGQWKMEFAYVVSKETAYDNLPAEGSSVPPAFLIPNVTVGLELTSTKFSVNDMPGYYDLRLIYTLPKSESTGTPVREGDTTLEGNTTFREVPIEQAKTATGETLSDSEIAMLKAENQQTKSAFQSQFTNTTVESDDGISETELISGVGKRSNPIGLTGVGTSYPDQEQDRWLLTSKQLSTIQGGNRQVRQTWTYDETGWADLLYADEAPA